MVRGTSHARGKTKNRGRNFLKGIASSIAALALVFGGGALPAYAADTAVDLVKSLDTTQVGNDGNIFKTGGLVRYNLKISCLSLTEECGQGIITDVLDENLEFVEVANPSGADITSDYAAATRTVTITANEFQAGDTLEVVLVARVKSAPNSANGGEVDADGYGLIHNTATARPSEGDTVTSGPVTIRVPQVEPDWGVAKVQNISTVGPDGVIQYTIRATVPIDRVLGNVNVTGGTLTDTYPAGAVVTDANGGTVDETTHTITWNIGAIATSSLTCDTTLGYCYINLRTVRIQYPSATFPEDTELVNGVDANYSFVDGTTGTAHAEVTATVIAPVISSSFNKGGPATATVGQSVRWNLNYTNGGNQPVGAVIEDTLPVGAVGDFVLTTNHGNSNWRLETLEGGTWTQIHPTSGDWATGSAGPAGIALGDAEKFRVTYESVNPSTFVQLLLDGTVLDADLGSNFQNCAVATPTSGEAINSCVTTTIANPAVQMRTAKVHRFNDSGASAVKPGDEFLWGVATKYHGGAPLTTAWVADSLPPQFEYVETLCVTQVADASWAGTNTGAQAGFNTAASAANCDPATAIEPAQSATDNPVANSTMLVWDDVPVDQARTSGGSNVTWVVFKVRVKAGTAVGAYTNTSWTGTDEATATCVTASHTAPSPIDPASNSCSTTDDVIIQESAVIDLKKWDKGPLPNVAQATGLASEACPDWDGFTRYPCVAQTPPDGTFEYRFDMTNLGNITMTDHVMYDILPHVGDTGVSQTLSSGARGTQWTPELTGPIVIEQEADGANVTVEYNLTYNPCRPEVASGAADANWQTSCDNDWYSADQISDWSTVKSFRVKSFSDGGAWAPGDQTILRAAMHAPEDAEESVLDPLDLSIAWNSMAHRVHRLNADLTTERLLAAEPLKVGIIVPFPGVSVGDYVWLDNNRDGLQSTGEPGVPGVKVTLKNAAGTVVGETETDADGYYYFQYLEPGKDYTITFEKPASLDYVYTTLNAGAKTDNSATEDLNDSDAVVDATDPAIATISFTSPLTGANLIGPGQSDNPGLDAGFVRASTPVSIGDYVWYDTNRDGQQDADEPVVPAMTVELWSGDGETKVGETTTSDEGYYAFTDLDPETDYIVKFVKPAGTEFTLQTTGASATDSNADRTTGEAPVTTPAEGENSGEPGEADDPTIDAGLLKYNLLLQKALVPGGPYYTGATVTYTLTPSNDGPVDALAGWSVTELMPAELTLTGLSGTGYTCDVDSATCVAGAKLAAGATGAPITVTATVTSAINGTARNVAYVAPAEHDVPETNPLGTPPTNNTDTAASPTDNDAEAEITVASLVSVGDYVWWDVNRDGQQTTGEDPVPGVTVNLFTENGTDPLKTTTTNGEGYYSFTDLTPGANYRIEFVKPTDTQFTSQNTGDDASDSDPNAAGVVNFTAPVSGANSSEPGQADDPTIDAGLVKYNLVLEKSRTSTGAVYKGSTVTFELVPSNQGPVNALAGWSVTDLLPEGMSLVSMVGDGYSCDVATATCVADEQLAAGASGSPITVTATVETRFVGELVNVAYIAPAADDIVETNPLVVPTRQTPDTPATRTGETPTDNDAEAPVSTDSLVSIGDYVWYDHDRDGLQGGDRDLPVNGMTVNLYGENGTGAPLATTTTNGDGYYVFTDLVPGTKYVVEFVKDPAYSFTTQNAGADDTADSDADPTTGRVSVTAPASGSNSAEPGKADDPSIDAGIARYNLSIEKTLVTDGKVYPGDTVVFEIVVHNDGPSDSLGSWSINDLLPEGLTLTGMSGDGFECDLDTATCLSEDPLQAGSDSATITVTATVERGVKGDLRNIAYVSPNPSDEVPEDNPLEVPDGDTDTGESPTDNDDEAPVTVTPLVSVGDYVWMDVDRDGLQGEGEPAIAGVKVNLYAGDGGGDPIATTTTDERGFYSFTDLKAGEKYTIEFVKPKDHTFTGRDADDEASDDADSDANPETGRVTFVAPLDGDNSALTPDDPTIDAGFVIYDLVLTKELIGNSPFKAGQQVTFELTIRNDGPVDVLAGWSVKDELPKGLKLVSMTGEGYDCSGAECVARDVLAAGETAAKITVVAEVTSEVIGEVVNDAVLAASPDDAPEPNIENNRDRADITVIPNPLATTGGSSSSGLIFLGGGLFLAGLLLAGFGLAWRSRTRLVAE